MCSNEATDHQHAQKTDTVRVTDDLKADLLVLTGLFIVTSFIILSWMI